MQHNAKPAAFILSRFFFNFNGPGAAEGSVRLQKVHIAKAAGMFYSLAPWSQNSAQDGASVARGDERCGTEKTAADVIFWFRVLADFH